MKQATALLIVLLVAFHGALYLIQRKRIGMASWRDTWRKNFPKQTLSGKLFNSIYVDLNKYCVLNNLVPAINILADFLSQIIFGANVFAALRLHYLNFCTFQYHRNAIRESNV